MQPNMNDHISRLELGMDVARLYMRRATCLRRHVGAILMRDKRIIASGYNGSLKGQPHCTPDTCNDSGPCPNTVHAEANIIAFCARHGIPTEGTIMMVTASPCEVCAKSIVQAGVEMVIYDDEFRDSRGMQILKAAGILLYKYTPELKINWERPYNALRQEDLQDLERR